MLDSKPTYGRLWYDGKLIAKDLAFYVLQNKKKALIKVGYKKELFKITY